jgi:hypothetical protein
LGESAAGGDCSRVCPLGELERPTEAEHRERKAAVSADAGVAPVKPTPSLRYCLVAARSAAPFSGGRIATPRGFAPVVSVPRSAAALLRSAAADAPL